MIKAPRGTHDIMGQEMERWLRLEATARDVLARYAYEEIRTPIFEAGELFARSVGEDTDVVGKQMYAFQDRKGRSLALRPEATASVVRAVIQSGLAGAGGPLRLYYLGPMFRYERTQKGRQRQFHQLGVEVLGAEAPEVDAEVIDAVLLLLHCWGIEGAELRLNSLGDRECRPAYREKLVRFLDSVAEQLCADCDRRRASNPLRVLDCKQEGCRQSTLEAPAMLEHLCEPCSRHFQGVRESLDALDRPYTIDRRLVRGLDYYERTAFEVVHGGLGSQDSLLGGGRYDGLSELLGGPRLPGVGWAAGLERLVLVLPEAEVQAKALTAVVAVGTAAVRRGLVLARRLRERGEIVMVDFKNRSFKAQLRAADRRGATRALILGEDELARGEVTLKDLGTGEQKCVPEGEL